MHTPAGPPGRTHPPGAPAFRAGARRPGRGHRHLLGEGHHPGPGQSPGAARRGPEAALPAAPLPRRRRPGKGDAGPALLPRQGGVTGVAGPGGTGPPADGSAPQPRPARGRHGAEQFPDTGNGPSPGRGHRWPVHHGLEQGQRGRRQLRQDRPALPAGAGPVGGGPGLGGGEGGEQARPGLHRPWRPRGVRNDRAGKVQGGLPAPVPGPAEDGAAAQAPQPPGPGIPSGPDPPRRGRPGQRRVPVRGALPPRGFLGVRPPLGGAGPWRGAAASSCGRSRWCSSSWTWPG